ncbi:hypothetical protein N305_08562, partial [Manacus vitellinus]
NTPGKLWTTGQGGETQISHSDLTPSSTTIAGSPHSEIQADKVRDLQGPPFASSGKTLGMKAVKKISNLTTSTPAMQSSDGDSDSDKMGSSSSSKGTTPQSNAREVPLQQGVTTSRATTPGNRSIKQSSHSTGITSTQQDANSKASSFETT